MSAQPEHFKGKDALGHVAEAQAQGIIASVEVHGHEIPGHISAAADCARDIAVILLLLGTLLFSFLPFPNPLFSLMSLFGCSYLVWKAGRSAWLGWFRLERLHRVLEQERWEIEHHRQQERDELRVLYAAKGLEGKLLEDVLDVLMADDNRLLQVMVEEELGLSLESQEHPLKQGFGAFLGGLFALSICLSLFWFASMIGLMVGVVLVIAIASSVSAYHTQNRWIPAIVWNLGLAGVAFGIIYLVNSL